MSSCQGVGKVEGKFCTSEQSCVLKSTKLPALPSFIVLVATVDRQVNASTVAVCTHYTRLIQEKVEDKVLGIFSGQLNNLEENDLTDLVDVRRLREHIHLDYKEETYSHGREGTVEMLADVTALANAQGGYILIGVSEDNTQPDGTPKDLLGIENGDEEVRWIQNVCLSSIEEKITGLQVRDIDLSNGRRHDVRN